MKEIIFIVSSITEVESHLICSNSKSRSVIKVRKIGVSVLKQYFGRNVTSLDIANLFHLNESTVRMYWRQHEENLVDFDYRRDFNKSLNTFSRIYRKGQVQYDKDSNSFLKKEAFSRNEMDYETKPLNYNYLDVKKESFVYK